HRGDDQEPGPVGDDDVATGVYGGAAGQGERRPGGRLGVVYAAWVPAARDRVDVAGLHRQAVVAARPGGDDADHRRERRLQRGGGRVGDDQVAVVVGGHLADRVAERVAGGRAPVVAGVGDAAGDPGDRIAAASRHAEGVEAAGSPGDDADQRAHVV